MKKMIYGAAALMLLATASCKKDDDATGPSNSIVAAGTTYAVTGFTSNRNTVMISGGSGTANAVSYTLTFGTGSAVPTKGTYNIVEDADEADEVEITVLRYVNSTLTTYTSRDNSPNVSVDFDGSKMKISFPNTTVVPNVGQGSDNITISANAVQP